MQRPAPLGGHRVQGGHGVQRAAPQLVPQYPADAGHGGHVVLVADAVCQESVSDLPREDAGVFRFQLFDVRDHLE